MVQYNCNICNKQFNQKCHWIQHTKNKKRPCKLNTIIIKKTKEDFEENIRGVRVININKKYICNFCMQGFSRSDNLKRHIDNNKCKILILQKQQKENIFVNLVKEGEINNATNNKLLELKEYKKISELSKLLSKSNQIIIEDNQMQSLIKEIQNIKNKFKKNLEEHKNEVENKLKLEFNIKIENQQKIMEEHKKELENKIKIEVENKYLELEKNNVKLQRLNYKLQNKMDKIVLKNKFKINTLNTLNTLNTHNITNNIVMNYPNIKLVDFGNEDLEKISHTVFIDTIRTQGSGLYNKAIDGIHFNKDYPENQNIYISDFNRDKVMIYKNEKWFLDNWENIFPELLEKVIQFGYDKNEFLLDCNYRLDGKKFNKQMIKNGMRWYKLLSEDEPDIDYFTLDETDRPEIDEQTYNDYLEMQEFRKSHPKRQTECNIKNKMKLNIYNKREIPIENYKKITNIDMNKVKLIE